MKIAINTAYSAATDCITAEGSQKVPSVVLPVLSFPERGKEAQNNQSKNKEDFQLVSFQVSQFHS